MSSNALRHCHQSRGGREALQAGGAAEAACWGLIAALETRLPARPCNVFYHQYKGTLTCVGPAAVCGKKSERKKSIYGLYSVAKSAAIGADFSTWILFCRSATCEHTLNL